MSKFILLALLLSFQMPLLAQKISFITSSRDMPVGGKKGAMDIIKKEFVYPTEDVKARTEGEVRIGFLLPPDGKPLEIEVLKAPSESLGREALKMFKKMKWRENKNRSIRTDQKDQFILDFSLKKWVNLYNKRGYKNIPYPHQPIDSSEKIHYASSLEDKPFPIFKNNEYAGFQEYILAKLEYPEDAKKLGLKGEVVIAFVIEPSGNITNIEVRKPLQAGCTDEALSVIKTVEWFPGLKDGKAVRTQMVSSIGFGVRSNTFFESFNQSGTTTN